ncbi:hypothetical protein ABZ816_18315 [Actinosynnema sp. NPDC047251]|uniref:Uncharacterized protein n=1 Tax=Saccharothrix espanaensis (strain ATCC 51144 / DSM 44229 / JCM 9112 / NBRC 15066 / NRRL 15764) TaxID=1179773 RepID=K0K4Z8_SACES|nr:hypothetical protein [Saccharothrix espanaensis]CCH33386.1 hypothetical protein BN6_61340 [Saccharothrix espanaensis DSM 44229]
MIKPVEGMHDLVSLLDDVIGARPRLPTPVVVVVADDQAVGTGFLDGVRQRLVDVEDADLVPAAHVGQVLATAAEKHPLPDVRLLHQVAEEFAGSIPSGAGKRWRPRRFTLCLDIVEAGPEIGAASLVNQKSALLDHLYRRWEERNGLIGWARRMSTEDLPLRLPGLLLTALLSGPSRWLFHRRLNGRSTRWLRAHVKSASGLKGDFASQAVWLLPANGLEGLPSLRRRVLVDALLQDLADLTRRGRFSPRRRRRRWTPVLLVDGTRPLAADLLTQVAEQVKDLRPGPLVVVGTLPPDLAAVTVKTEHDVPDAVRVLRRVVNGERSALAQPPYLAVRVPAGPAHPAAQTWLGSHRRVDLRVPGISAYVPLALTVALVAGAVAYAGYEYWLGGCADTRTSAGQVVGVVDGRCSFVDGGLAHAPGVPVLADLERQVADNNAAVDGMKDLDGRQRYYREVVFFAPLTRADQSESTAPPNAIWQLEGAVREQRKHNERATQVNEDVPVKLVLANSGDRFTDGRWVAGKIAQRPRSGRGGLAAVIGISQSRQDAFDAVRVELSGVPVIGASMYGRQMAKNANMFLSAPFNSAYAEVIAGWVRGRPGQDRDAPQAAVVYDPDDPYYSAELHSELKTRGIGSVAKNIEIREKPGNTPELGQDDVERLCRESDRVVPVLVGRGDQLLKLLAMASNSTACTNPPGGKLRLITGPGGLVVDAAGEFDRYPWAEVSVTGLVDTPGKQGVTAADSERATGAEAFGVAAQAIREAHELTQGADWDTSQILAVLRGEDFTHNGHRLNDEEVRSDRVVVIGPS